ncbi:hypothetical protein AAE026_22005 [Bradyrhizobium sp. DN5]|uniref:hypothetical protein n=1 Tax=Bradyrhizobium sp. DN5 TaxID=3056950 RepID=UPI0035251594
MTIGVSAASAHHPGIGGIGGSGGILTIGAGTLDDGQFAFSAFVDYLRLKQLSEPTLLANVGNNVHGLQTVESYAVAFDFPGFGYQPLLVRSKSHAGPRFSWKIHNNLVRALVFNLDASYIRPWLASRTLCCFQPISAYRHKPWWVLG